MSGNPLVVRSNFSIAAKITLSGTSTDSTTSFDNQEEDHQGISLPLELGRKITETSSVTLT